MGGDGISVAEFRVFIMLPIVFYRSCRPASFIVDVGTIRVEEKAYVSCTSMA